MYVEQRITNRFTAKDGNNQHYEVVEITEIHHANGMEVVGYRTYQLEDRSKLNQSETDENEFTIVLTDVVIRRF